MESAYPIVRVYPDWTHVWNCGHRLWLWLWWWCYDDDDDDVDAQKPKTVCIDVEQNDR